ncbi:MAG: hypothetical protein ABI867_04370 [Kofleriaceae bacterium]
MSVPKSGDHATLPPPTTPAARDAWEPANLTSASIERSDEQRQRFLARTRRRDPDISEALHLGLGSLLLPMVGPCAWQFANAELAAIAAGHTSDRGRGWLVIAKLCGIASTFAMVAAMVASIVVVAS